MATFLITGGAGFIGSHLAEEALRRGDRVLLLDNLSSGRASNLDQLLAADRCEFFEGDVATDPRLPDLVAAADVVFHLAATVGVFNVVNSPATTIENNVDGTTAVLRAALHRRTKVLVTSTSEVYGKGARIPFREDDDLLLGPSSMGRWGYAASKLVDEFLALAYWREHHLPTVVVRPFNTIGPRQVGQYGMVVPRFLARAMAGQKLMVYGTGQQSRSFTYVSDVVHWLLALASLDAAVGQVFNLGNPVETTINELANRVIAICGHTATVEHVDYADAYQSGFEDLTRRVPDIGKVVRVTQHAPQVHLDEALLRTRDWLASQPPSPS